MAFNPTGSGADVDLTLGFKLSPQGEAQINAIAQKVQTKFNSLASPFDDMAKSAGGLSNALDRANSRVINLGSSYLFLRGATDMMKRLVDSTIEVEKAMVDINAVFQLSGSNISKFGKDLFNVARETSQSFSVAAEAAKEFSRQGLSMQETLKRTRDALVLTRLSGLDAADSVNTLTASINGFQKSALDSTQIVNKLATVDAAFAVSSRDLAQGLARAGAAASDAGVNFDQLIGLITAAKQTTGRDGAVIGNALKSIFTRVERSSTIEAFESLGVQVRDLSGSVLPAMQLLTNFAKVYDTLGTATRKQAAEMVGGVYQINILKALVNDLERGGKSITGQASGISAGSTDEALRRNEMLNKSLESTIARAKAVSQQIGSNLGGNFSGPIKSFLNYSNDNFITKAFEDADGHAESMGGKVAETFLKGFSNVALSTVAPMVGIALAKIGKSLVTSTIKNFAEDAGVQMGGRASMEKQVLQAYNSEDIVLKSQLATLTSATDRAAVLANYFNRMAAASDKVRANMSADVNALAGMGWRGTGTVKRAADGYIPNAAGGINGALSAESQAISANVGGGGGSRPVLLPSFNFGGGNTGPLVANSSEFIVKNYAGGGSAIFNRDMIYKNGLPPGAVPIASNGYVPNAAGGFGNELPDAYEKMLARAANRPVSNTGPIGVFSTPSSTLGGLSLQEALKIAMDKTLAKQEAVNKAWDSVNTGLTEYYKTLPKVTWGTKKAGNALEDYAKTVAYASQVANVKIVSGGRQTDADLIRGLEGEGMSPGSISSGTSGMAWEAYAKRDARLAARRRGMTAAPQSWSLGGFNEKYGNRAMQAAFVLPFLSGMLPNGTSGSTSGMLSGGLGGAANGFGTGAAIGSFIGPLGTAGGGVLGALSGAIVGLISRSTKSIEEIAQEVDNVITRGKERVQAVITYNAAKEQLDQAEAAGASPKQLKMLRMQLGAAKGGLASGDFSLIGNLGGQDAMLRIQEEQQKAMVRENAKFALMSIGESSGSFTGLKRTSDLDKLAGTAAQGSKLTSRNLFDLAQQVQGNVGFVQAESIISKILPSDISEQEAKELTDKLLSKLSKGDLSENLRILLEGMRKAANDRETPNKETPESLAEKTQRTYLANLTSRQRALESSSNLSQIGFRGQLLQSGFNTARFGYSQAYGVAQEAEIGLSAAKANESYESQRAAMEIRKRLLEAAGGAGATDSALIKEIQSAQGVEGFQSIFAKYGDVNKPTANGQRGYSKDIAAVADFYNQQKIAMDSVKANTKEATDKNEEAKRLLDLYNKSNDDMFDAEAKLRSSNIENVKKDFADRENIARIEFQASQGGYSTRKYAELRGAAGVGLARTKLSQFEGSRVDNLRLAFLSKVTNDEDRRKIGGFTGTDQFSLFAGAQNDQGKQREFMAIVNESETKRLDLENAITEAIRTQREELEKTDTSFKSGFITTLKQGTKDWQSFRSVGEDAAASLQSNLGNSFGDFITGAKNGKEAFRSFVVGVLNDAARAMASKAVQALLFNAFGLGDTGAGATRMSGGTMGFASGGKVPALLTGGEYYFTPQQAKKIGYDNLRAVNRYAVGGVVRGGSGMRDDVPAMLNPGGFVMRKSAVQKLGVGYMDSMAAGNAPQRRFWGGFILPGMLLGAGIGYATGGGKGALIGAGIGAAAGAAGNYLSSGQWGTNTAQPIMRTNAEYNAAITNGTANAAPGTLTIGQKALIGAGALGLLGVAANNFGGNNSNGYLDAAGIERLRNQMEGSQQSEISSYSRSGQAPILQLNPQGGYSLLGYGYTPATRRFESGGDVGGMSIMPGGFGSGNDSPQTASGAQINITIHNNGGGNSSTDTKSNGINPDIAKELGNYVEYKFNDLLSKAQRNGGALRNQNRMLNPV